MTPRARTVTSGFVQHLERSAVIRSVVVEEVEAADLVRAVVGAEAGADAAVVDHLVQPVVASATVALTGQTYSQGAFSQCSQAMRLGRPTAGPPGCPRSSGRCGASASRGCARPASLPTTGMLFSAWQAMMQAPQPMQRGEVDGHAPAVLLLRVVDRSQGGRLRPAVLVQLAPGASGSSGASRASAMARPSMEKCSWVVTQVGLAGRSGGARRRSRTRGRRRCGGRRRRSRSPRATAPVTALAVAERERHGVVGVAGDHHAPAVDGRGRRSASSTSSPIGHAEAPGGGGRELGGVVPGELGDRVGQLLQPGVLGEAAVEHPVVERRSRPRGPRPREPAPAAPRPPGPGRARAARPGPRSPPRARRRARSSRRYRSRRRRRAPASPRARRRGRPCRPRRGTRPGARPRRRSRGAARRAAGRC